MTEYVICALTKVSSEEIMIKIRLRELLTEHGMTQFELAESTGIRPSTICDMCNNNCTFLKIQNIDSICKRLGCKIEDLIIIIPCVKE